MGLSCGESSVQSQTCTSYHTSFITQKKDYCIYYLLYFTKSRKNYSEGRQSGIHNKEQFSYLPKGILANIGSPLLGSLHHFLPISVMTTVGLTEFTLMFLGPSSKAQALVKASTAALLAQ